jgi:hypothetical protein
MSTEAENRTEPVNATWVDAAPASTKPVASEPVEAEHVNGARTRIDGRRIDGPRIDGPRVDGPRGDGARADGPRGGDALVDAPTVDLEPIDLERVEDAPVDGERLPPPVLEITVTADEAFARAMRRHEVRQGHRSLALTALVAILLIATSLGSTVASAPWWTAFGMLGLASGFIVCVVVIGTLFQRHETPPGMLDPTRYVFRLETLEWSTDSTTTRLNWSAVSGVRTLPHGYQINRQDGATAVVICRTTLTAEQDTRLRSYFSGLAATSTTTGA